MTHTWAVTLRDGRTATVTADALVCYGSGALEFRREEPGAGFGEENQNTAVLVAFGPSRWAEVRRSDVELNWTAPATAEAPPYVPDRF